MRKNFHQRSIQNLFIQDSTTYANALNMAVECPEDFREKFSDGVSYKKGMAVIRMMQHYLTDKIFKKGLQRYLNDFRYKAADADDFFKSIQKVVDEENLDIRVKAVMDTWVDKKGYPLVTVKRNYEQNTMLLKQERFVTYNASAEDIKTIWHIPISYATEKNRDFENTSARVLFNKAEETFPVDGAERDHWIILNKQQTGLYRVNYDEDNWKLIINYLNSPDREKIHPLNRAQLISDAFVLVQEEILGLQTLIQLTAQMKHETDYIAWFPAMGVLNHLKSKLIYSEYYPLFKEFAWKVMASVIKSVGFGATDNDDYIKKLSRSSITEFACTLGYDGCIILMQEKFEVWLKDKTNTLIPRALQRAVFCFGSRNASFSLWENVLNKTTCNANDYMQSLIDGLSCSNQKTVLERYLYDSLANKTCTNIAAAISSTVSNSDIGLDVVLDFIVQNIFKIHWQIDRKESLINLISSVGRAIKTKAQLTKLKAMGNSNILVPNDLISEAVSLAEKNIEWIQKHNEIFIREFKMEHKDEIQRLPAPL